MVDVLKELVKAMDSRESVALATIIDVQQGASPAQIGFKLLIWPDGRCVGNVGGGVVEKRIREAAKKATQKGRAQCIRYSLKEKDADAIWMLCG